MFNALKTDNSPFTEQQINLLQQSLGSLDVAKSMWLSGFIAGRLAGATEPFTQRHESAELQSLPGPRLLNVFFASQTGNGEEVARTLAADAERIGIGVEVQSVVSLRPSSLKKLRHAVFVVSTHGEGDPPDDALELFEYLQSPRAARLDGLEFCVLALGDRSYSQFCAAGRQLENLLLARGAKTFGKRVDCDIDYRNAVSSWSANVVGYAREKLAQEPDASLTSLAAQHAAHLSVVPPARRWTRANPFRATVEKVQKITGLESHKAVYHLEFSLENSGLQYQPGDAMGVWAHNRHELVAEILTALSIEEDEKITVDGCRKTVHELLTRQRELTRLSADTVRAYAKKAQHSELQNRFEQFDEKQRREFIERRQFADLLMEYPPQGGAKISAFELAAMLRPLAPRSYSISSSQLSVGESVHLTVATVSSRSSGAERHGVASDFLNHRLTPGQELGVFLEPNRRFHLPDDRKTPLILIAAGTGIAPYRAFLQQLEAEKEKPDCWLIFGNPHLRTDFLYQREWLDWRKRGLLARVDGAFSRDQEDKRYVQHVVVEQAQRIEEWLSRQARIYICGSLAMGQDVELALRDALAQQRGLSVEESMEQIAEMRRQGRLLKDLY